MEPVQENQELPSVVLDSIRQGPRLPRIFDVEPRGVILKIKDAPNWLRHINVQSLLQEMNTQGLFVKEIAQKYKLTPFRVKVLQYFIMEEFLLMALVTISFGITYYILNKPIPHYYLIKTVG